MVRDDYDQAPPFICFSRSPTCRPRMETCRCPLDLGIRALFTSCYHGQAHGNFSGLGVGKSVLLSMLARNVAANLSVWQLLSFYGDKGELIRLDAFRKGSKPETDQAN